MNARYKKWSLSEAERIWREAANDLARSTVAVVLYELQLRGWHNDKIKEFFNALVMLFKQPPLLGRKKIDTLELQIYFEKKLGIDFKDIVVDVANPTENRISNRAAKENEKRK